MNKWIKEAFSILDPLWDLTASNGTFFLPVSRGAVLIAFPNKEEAVESTGTPGTFVGGCKRVKGDQRNMSGKREPSGAVSWSI